MHPDPAGGVPVPVEDDGAERLFRHPLVVVAMLAAAAGFVDAYAYSTLGIFVANMTGNVVFLGLALGGVQAQGRLSALALVGFTGGAMLGVWLRSVGARRDPRAGTVLPLTVQCLLMLVVIAGLRRYPVEAGTDHSSWPVSVGVVLLAVVNGLQAFVITRVHGVATPTTYATGAVVATSSGALASVLDRGSDEGAVWRRRLTIAVTTPAGYLLGAYGYAGLHDARMALWLPLMIMVVVLIAALRRRRSFT